MLKVDWLNKGIKQPQTFGEQGQVAQKLMKLN